MDLYIDKENLLSMIASRSSEMYNDCLKLIKKQLNVHFNFPKEDLRSNEHLLLWYQTLSQGVGESNEFKFNEPFPAKPIKSNSARNFDIFQLSSIYLLSDENTSKFKDSGNVLIGEKGEELTTIQKLFFNQNDYLFEKKLKIGGKYFTKWEDLSPFSLPLTDIIFVDSYILSNLELLEHNLLSYLKILCSETNSKVNIVLYTNRGNSVDYDVISPLVRKTLKEVTGVSPNFTLVTYSDQRGMKSIAEHDRTILLNYYRVHSGDTFNYFDSSCKKISKGREIHYASNANKENHELFIGTLSDIQENINFLIKNNSGIEGDRKSGFLNLNKE